MSVWQALSSCQTAYPTSLHLTPVVTWYNKTVEGVLIEQKNWEAFQSLCREKKQRYCIETLWNDVLKEANGFFFFFFKISVFIYLSSKSVWVISLWFLYQIYQEDNAVPVYTTLISSHRWLFACIGMTVAGITTISVSPKVYIKSKTLD